MLAVVPLTGLVLAGCGGSDASSSAGEQTIGVQQETTTSASSPTAAASTSAERFDITSLMVCDVVETTMADLQGETSATKAQNTLGRALATAFEGSTTPRATVADVKIDRMMKSGCPGLNAKALLLTGLDDLSQLPVK
ncbi:hypothetical protein KIH74_12225 [Kineosporia sp. J2-2]|uniref:Lipoprotein n=1 Tax=Kineosporia corallincola TaxID=2835133 RepID=A0ABS5TF31_9ACTN|nr:hypothetical protein [Kineosporia corallincola]MBT0769695.1 hypothetical protein [Kineosporia corallincola]